jgi:hypothetical protein
LHQPPAIRFSSRILAGQTIDLSMPDAAASADTVLEITRPGALSASLLRPSTQRRS